MKPMNKSKQDLIKITGNILIAILGLSLIANCDLKKQGASNSFMKRPEISEFQNPAYPAPDWLRDAVIMEIPIRAFNHPDYNNPQNWKNNCGNASYTSIIEKLEFLKDFGINVICLYSIYHHSPGTNLYAMKHHKADPTLGTLDDIKTLLEEAHKVGIHVISNTNCYGVNPDSPMITEHPDWFLSPENTLFAQRVFDFNNPEAVKYIIDTHAWWCTEIGLDGWRIDIAHRIYRKHIWDPVLEVCARKGKRILLATEKVHLDGHIRGAGWNNFPVSLNMEDPMESWDKHDDLFGTLNYVNVAAEDPYRMKDISSHNSTVPCPHNHNPEECPREGAYQVVGSRFLWGHNLMFSPFVPWMMHGEVFNATHLGVPGVLSHRLKGKLLHSYLDWDDLDEQQDVIRDFMKIGNIRREHSDIFHNNRYETHLLNIPCTSAPQSDVKPYARFVPGEKAAIIIGNDNAVDDVTFLLQIPLEDLGFTGETEITLTDLWTGKEETLNPVKLKEYPITVPRDKSPDGGVRVILIRK
ncbi:alpha-amylase family glycosyl hydrolase [Bacteroidota bacterium]